MLLKFLIYLNSYIVNKFTHFLDNLLLVKLPIIKSLNKTFCESGKADKFIFTNT